MRPHHYNKKPQDHSNDEPKNKPPKSQVEFVSKEDPNQVKMWLVQVPRFVMNVWEQLPEGEPVGFVKIQEVAGEEKPKVSMHLRDDYHENLPTEFLIEYNPVEGDQLHVFSEDGPGNLVAEGAINYKLNVKAKEDTQLRNTIIQRGTDFSEQEKKQVNLRVDHVDRRQQYNLTRKPVEKKVKEKRTPLEEHLLIPMILECFEEKSLWTLSEINFKLKQPEEHLKGFLRQYCDYHTQGKERSHYELKAEFRSKKRRKLNEKEDEEMED